MAPCAAIGLQQSQTRGLLEDGIGIITKLLTSDEPGNSVGEMIEFINGSMVREKYRSAVVGSWGRSSA